MVLSEVYSYIESNYPEIVKDISFEKFIAPLEKEKEILSRKFEPLSRITKDPMFQQLIQKCQDDQQENNRDHKILQIAFPDELLENLQNIVSLFSNSSTPIVRKRGRPPSSESVAKKQKLLL